MSLQEVKDEIPPQPEDDAVDEFGGHYDPPVPFCDALNHVLPTPLNAIYCVAE